MYVKGYGFLYFAKNMGKNLSNKYGQKLFDSAKKSATDTIKTASKREIQKTAEVTGDLIGNKIADKITSVSQKSTKESYNNNDKIEEDMEITTHTNWSIAFLNSSLDSKMGFSNAGLRLYFELFPNSQKD